MRNGTRVEACQLSMETFCAWTHLHSGTWRYYFLAALCSVHDNPQLVHWCTAADAEKSAILDAA